MYFTLGLRIVELCLRTPMRAFGGRPLISLVDPGRVKPEALAQLELRAGQALHTRKLRRYKRRWKVERLFAWLGNFRRLVGRYEWRVENYLGFVRLGCVMILLRQF
jgi:hypothetical protein